MFDVTAVWLLGDHGYAGSDPVLLHADGAMKPKASRAGLEQRDPDLLDCLIEQYQYRLFRLPGLRHRK